MLQRVVETLLGEGRFEQIVVSIDQPDLLGRHPGLARHIDSGALLVLKSEDTPSRSVLAGLDVAGAPPVLVTTADHALLDGAMLDHFLGESSASGADLVIALVPRSTIERRFPNAKRTYLRFRGESYSGANLFAFRTREARHAAEFWRRAERHRKQPWKLVGSFGWLSLLLFVTRSLDLSSAMKRASATLGLTVHAVEMPMAEAAVDVDKIEDLELVRSILTERRLSR